jgi:hypothetical protein
MEPSLLSGGSIVLWGRDAQSSGRTMAMPGNNFVAAVRTWTILMFIVVLVAIVAHWLLG